MKRAGEIFSHICKALGVLCASHLSRSSGVAAVQEYRMGSSPQLPVELQIAPPPEF
jgi:hypothetical protein